MKMYPHARLPTRGSPQSAGLDVYSISGGVIEPGQRQLIHTGIALKGLPEGTYLRIAPRSGLALKGIDVCAGVVDPDYRGEICIVLANNSYPPTKFVFEEQMRIAQMIIESCRYVDVFETTDKDIPSERGTGGFGSTGVM